MKKHAMITILLSLRHWILAPALLVAAVTAVSAASPKFMISTDMMQPQLYLTNIDTDQRIGVDLSKDPLWPGECHCTLSSPRTAARAI
jgi:hypothetical protein